MKKKQFTYIISMFYCSWEITFCEFIGKVAKHFQTFQLTHHAELLYFIPIWLIVLLWSTLTASPCQKTGVDYSGAVEIKTLSLFLYHGSILSHQEAWLLLLDVLMKAALAITLPRQGHSFSLSAWIFFFLGFTGMKREQTICEAHSGIISVTFLKDYRSVYRPALCSFYLIRADIKDSLLLCEII